MVILDAQHIYDESGYVIGYYVNEHCSDADFIEAVAQWDDELDIESEDIKRTYWEIVEVDEPWDVEFVKSTADSGTPVTYWEKP